MYAFVMALSGYAWYRHTRRRSVKSVVWWWMGGWMARWIHGGISVSRSIPFNTTHLTITHTHTHKFTERSWAG